jgi:hypothetical protein
MPLNVVVVPIALGDLLLLVLFRGCLIALEDDLLQERRFRRHKMGALQLQKQGAGKSEIIRNQ